MRKEDPSKVLLKNMEYLKQAYLFVQNNFVKNAKQTKKSKAEYDHMRGNLQLKKQLVELKKENGFLKKAAAFFAKESIRGLSIPSEI